MIPLSMWALPAMCVESRASPPGRLTAGRARRPSLHRITHHAVTVLIQNHLAQRLFEHLGGDGRGDLSVVLRRIIFHDVSSGDFPGDGLNMRESFPSRHSARLAMRDAGRKGGIERVHVEGDINGAIDFHPLRCGQVAHFDYFDAEFPGLLALMSVDGPNTDLDQTLGCALFHDACER